MANLIQHCTEEIASRRVYRDGDLDATLLEDLYVKANTLYLIAHGLGRPVKQYSVVFCDQAIKTPACVRDAMGRFINDAEKIALKFDAANVTVRMRFA